MFDNQTSRRNFVKTAAVGMGGTGIIAGIDLPRASAETLPGTSPNFDVRAFGAKGDGKTIDTPAINRAIEAAAGAGGGTVQFPAGNYLCYSIRLKSNVSLYLGAGCKIIAARPEGANGYDPAEPRQAWEDYQDYGHNHWHNSLIWGEGLENVSITGPGLIWGKGLSRGWRPQMEIRNGWNEPLPPMAAEDPGVGNKAIALKNCRNVLLRDFAILHGGHFGILATGVDNFTIDNLIIDTNRDGIDLDCCCNVHVSNCSINSPWDDAIVPKSSYALGYLRGSDMVTISNCLVTGSYEEGSLLDGTRKPFPAQKRVSRTGRIKFGTESNGSFRNVTITNCVFEGCHGLALESVDGTLLEDFTISNITMRNIYQSPIFIRLGARMRGPAGTPVGSIRRVLINNVVCYNATSPVCSILSGIPGHYLEDIKLSNILIHHQGNGTRAMAALQPAEEVSKYPDPHMFGDMPAHGFFIRHAKGLEMRDVRIQSEAEDARPPFVLEDVHGVDLFNVRFPRTANVPGFVLKEVSHFGIALSRPLPDTFLENVESREI